MTTAAFNQSTLGWKGGERRYVVVSCLVPIDCRMIARISGVLVCTDLWDKELHRQVCMGIAVTSGSLDGTLAWKARNVGLSSALDTIFSIFVTLKTLVAMTMILYKLHAVWLLNLPCVCICKGNCLYVCNL